MNILLFLLLFLQSQPTSDPLEGAAERIERIRKGDVELTLVDGEGKPVSGREIEIRQKRHSFLFGANIMWLFQLDPEREARYEERFTEIFNSATIAFYWGSYEPQKGKTNEEYARRVAKWCKERGITAKGHPLIWHHVYPEWAPQEAAETKKLLEERVRKIVKEFSGDLDRWDVVNEAPFMAMGIGPTNGATRWVKEAGTVNAVTEALTWARESNPKAFLIYNENMLKKPFDELVAGLLERKAPVDAFGLQSHMHTGEWPLAEIWGFCEKYAKFGKPLHWTEISVLSGEPMKTPDWETVRKDWESTPEGEKRQAEYVERLYTLLFSHPAVEVITWWDMPDGGWLGAPSGLVRKDMSPKPAYEGIRKLIRETWWTTLKAKSDDKGVVRFRGFGGDYSAMSGEASRSFSVRPRESNPVRMTLP